MRAAAYDRYGPPEVVSWRELDPPRPRRREVLVRVEAAALNPKDVLLRKGRFRALSGHSFPRPIGFDLVGHVVGLGFMVPSDVAGVRVFGFLSGLRARSGAIAALATIPLAQVAPIDKTIDSAIAAATPLAGSTALQALRDDASLVAGERVLIVGASGGVGTFAVQIAKLLGAHVSATASAANLELVRSLGADEVFDRAAAPLGLGRGRYDIVLDCFGKLRTAQVAGALYPRGRFVTLVPSRDRIVDLARGALFGPRTRLTAVKPRAQDLSQLASWLKQGLLKPVIEKVYEESELLDAMRHLETRHARGKLVIRIREG